LLQQTREARAAITAQRDGLTAPAGISRGYPLKFFGLAAPAVLPEHQNG
jgi:hypothetical protein